MFRTRVYVRNLLDKDSDDAATKEYYSSKDPFIF